MITRDSTSSSHTKVIFSTFYIAYVALHSYYKYGVNLLSRVGETKVGISVLMRYVIIVNIGETCALTDVIVAGCSGEV